MSRPVLYSVFPVTVPGSWSIQLSKCRRAKSQCYVNAKVELTSLILDNPLAYRKGVFEL